MADSVEVVVTVTLVSVDVAVAVVSVDVVAVPDGLQGPALIPWTSRAARMAGINLSMVIVVVGCCIKSDCKVATERVSTTMPAERVAVMDTKEGIDNSWGFNSVSVHAGDYAVHI